MRSLISFSVVCFFWVFFPFALRAQQAGIAGFVTDRYNAVENAIIRIENTTITTTSGMDGSFELRLPAGEQTIVIESKGYLPLRIPLNLAPGQQLTKVFALETRSDKVLNPQVTTVTRTDQYVSDAPATSYVITEEQIARRGYRTIQDIFKDIPEIDIQKNATEEARDVISIRGVSGNEKFVILLDGVQISVATGELSYVGNNFSVLNAKRVEVILGPASSLYGADAFSGIVNIITRTPDEAGNNLQVTQSQGRFLTFDQSIVGTAKRGNWHTCFYGQYYTSREANFPKFYPQEFAWYNQNFATKGQMINPYGENGADTVTVGDNISRKFALPSQAGFAHAHVGYKAWEVGATYHTTTQSSSSSAMPQHTIYNKDAIFSTNVLNVYAKHLLTAAGGKLTLQSMLWRSTFQSAPNTTFLNNYSSFTYGYKYEASSVTRLLEQLTYKITPLIILSAGIQLDTITAIGKSADLPRPYNSNVSTEQQDIYYFGTDIKDNQGRDLNIPIKFYPANSRAIGAYAQVRFSTPKRALEATVGLRSDYNTRFKQNFNPRIGIVYAPISTNRERLKLKFLYSEAFLSPSPWKSFSHYGSFKPLRDTANGSVIGLSSDYFHLPNPNLRPEKLRSLEISALYKPSKQLFINSSLYYIFIRDLITQFGEDKPGPGSLYNGYFPVSTISDQLIPVSYIEISQNQGVAASYGGTLRLNGLYEVGTFEIEPFLSYGFCGGAVSSRDTTFSALNNLAFSGSTSIQRLPLMASHIVRAGVSISRGSFSIFPSFTFRSRVVGTGSTDSDTNKNGIGENLYGQDLRSPAYALLNCYARYQILSAKGYRFSIFGNLTNALDARYYNVSFGGGTVMPEVPQDPLRWTIGLTMDLSK